MCESVHKKGKIGVQQIDYLFSKCHTVKTLTHHECVAHSRNRNSIEKFDVCGKLNLATLFKCHDTFNTVC